MENYDLHCCYAFNLQCLSKQFHSNYLMENGEWRMENYDLHCCNAFNLQCLSKQFHSNYLIENGEWRIMICIVAMHLISNVCLNSYEHQILLSHYEL